MLKKLLYVLFIFPLTLHAQTDSVYFGKKRSWMFGSTITPNFELETGGPYVFAPRINPRAGYFLKDKWLIGLSSEHSFIISKIVENKKFIMAGPFARYHFFPKNPVFLEAGYQVGDLYHTLDTLSRPLQQRGVVGAGANLKLNDKWYFEIGAAYRFRLTETTGPGLDFTTLKVGVNYILHPAQDRKLIAERIKAKKNHQTTNKQDEPALVLSDRFYGGLAMSFYFDSLAEGPYKELVLNPRIGYHLTRNLSAGLKGIFIRTYGNSADSRHYYFAGPFLNYDIPSKSPINLYFEVNQLMSNYEATATGHIKKENNLQYWGAGGGLKFAVTNHFLLDFALILQERLNTKTYTEGFTHYRIGAIYYPFKLKTPGFTPRYS